jgi:uncharacterized membrane protein
MKTRHLGIVAAVLAASSIFLALYLSGQGCSPVLVYHIILVVSLQVGAIAIIFGLFLKMNSRKISLLLGRIK